MLRPQVRLVLLIQALGLRACNTPGQGERGHLELQHLLREPQPHRGPRVAGAGHWAPTGGDEGREGTPHWCLVLTVGNHSGARPCGKAKMPSLVSSSSPRYRKEMGGLEIKQPANNREAALRAAALTSVSPRREKRVQAHR